MPLNPLHDVPDIFSRFTPAQTVRMVQAMAGLAALGGTHRQVSPPEVARRVHITDEVAKQALEDLVSCGYVLHHITEGNPDLNSYRIKA